ncbi:hypothetical protein Cgig2_009280 [Carnegiea gigantea]|uniref:Uncharacterized protein n=1 Tax=Carnegiea gigantea TaxID=171969 RepID=A0A9Q1GLM4_9CARY|nr:hypothetical protein Cgig2_009280 [Carnegiea gigantea]
MVQFCWNGKEEEMILGGPSKNRVLISAAWLDVYPATVPHNHIKRISDHCPMFEAKSINKQDLYLSLMIMAVCIELDPSSLQLRVPVVVIGDPSEVCRTLGLREPPAVHFAGRPCSLSALPCCSLRSLRRRRSKILPSPVRSIAVFRSPATFPVTGISPEFRHLTFSGPDLVDFSLAAAVSSVQSPLLEANILDLTDLTKGELPSKVFGVPLKRGKMNKGDLLEGGLELCFSFTNARSMVLYTTLAVSIQFMDSEMGVFSRVQQEIDLIVNRLGNELRNHLTGRNTLPDSFEDDLSYFKRLPEWSSEGYLRSNFRSPGAVGEGGRPIRRSSFGFLGSSLSFSSDLCTSGGIRCFPVKELGWPAVFVCHCQQVLWRFSDRWRLFHPPESLPEFPQATFSVAESAVLSFGGAAISNQPWDKDYHRNPRKGSRGLSLRASWGPKPHTLGT